MGIAPLILSLGTRRRRVVRFTPRSLSRSKKKTLYPLKRGAGWEPRLVWTILGKRKSLTPATIQKCSRLAKRSHQADHYIPCLCRIRRTIVKKGYRILTYLTTIFHMPCLYRQKWDKNGLNLFNT